MVSINISYLDGAGDLYIEAFGLSTDTKPTNAATGSKFTEVDTGKIYLFDSESDWVEQGTSNETTDA